MLKNPIPYNLKQCSEMISIHDQPDNAPHINMPKGLLILYYDLGLIDWGIMMAMAEKFRRIIKMAILH